MKKSDILGKWKMESWVYTSKTTHNQSHPFGKKPSGQLEFTESTFLSEADKPTEEVEVEFTSSSPLFNDGLTRHSHSGNYELEDDGIVLNFLLTTIPSLQGITRKRKIFFNEQNQLVLVGTHAFEDGEYDVEAVYSKA